MLSKYLKDSTFSSYFWSIDLIVIIILIIIQLVYYGALQQLKLEEARI